MPRLKSGVDYSPVVNNSRIEWTKLLQLEDARYLVVGTNKYWFDCFISRLIFTSKVHFTSFFNPKFSIILEASFCALSLKDFFCAFRRHLNYNRTISNGVISFLLEHLKFWTMP